MFRMLCVARREYRETAKTKFFLFNIFFTPVLIIGIMVLMRFMTEKATRGPRPPKTVAVLDLSNKLAQDLQQAFDHYNASQPQRVIRAEMLGLEAPGGNDAALSTDVEQVKAGVRAGKWDGALVVAKDVVDGNGRSHFYSKTRNIGDMELLGRAQSLHQDAVVNYRLRAHNLSPELIADLRREAPVTAVDVTAENEQQGTQFTRLITPFFLLFLMFMGIFGTSQGMLTSVIEEKNSRVVEVLLSAVSPFQLMAGKILGLAALGFTIMLVWGTVAYVGAASQGVSDLLNAAGIGYFAAYFVLGFLLFSSVFAAIGAMCNSTKEAQAMMTPLMILVIVPMMLWPYIAQSPHGAVAIALSFIPVTTPMIMILRIAAVPDLSRIEILASLVVLAASVPATMWAAAKIFRTGILMYGKPPSPREIVRWLRAG